MRLHKLGLIILIIGTLGGLVGYGSGLLWHDTVFNRVGVLANIIQIIGLAFILTDSPCPKKVTK